MPTVTFRCPRALDGRIPAPTPAAQGLPAWLRAMPAEAESFLAGGPDDTVKRCPPFIDAMAQGFLIPLVCDVTVERGVFTWDWDLPPDDGSWFPRAPMGFHDPAQVSGAPFANPGRHLVKFQNLWTIQTPPGWALFATHPVNYLDLPFQTLSGLVDADRYTDGWIHFPAIWRDAEFSGVLPAGTPVAQVIPVKRETWTVETAAFTPDDTARTRALLSEIAADRGVYRKKFRA
jgi:hypothetical protein